MSRTSIWPLVAPLVALACVDLAAPGPLDGGAGAGGGAGVGDAPTERAGGQSGDGGIDRPQDGGDAPPAPPDMAPARLGIGMACTEGAQCDSTFCTDGVCCNVACDGVCQACDVANAVGTCTPVPAGKDPALECAADDPKSCRLTGECDGAGQCQFQAAGTPCEAATCSGATLTPARTCDGAGTCQASTPTSCGGYKCGTDACLAKCNNSNDCVAPQFCEAGTCSGPKPPGTACAANGDCASGFCAQGVCCTTACSGTCKSCALAGKLGTCSAVAAGEDPLNQCTDKGAASCGNDGTCDGAGACRNYAAGTVCVAGKCEGSTLTPARTCDGAGTCRPQAMPSSCAPYACDEAGVCNRKCKAATDCVSGSTCTNMACTKKANGATCGVGVECTSGFCAQGVCCNAACNGNCEACNTSGMIGTCRTVSSCGGLKGEYYDNQDFTGTLLTRTDKKIEFDWAAGSPDPAIGSDLFSVRWTGKLYPRHSQTYTFYATVDDGIRLWIDGTLIIDQWPFRPVEHTGTIALTAGQAHDIKIEYWENTGPCYIRLYWSSASQQREIIPASQLSPAP